MSAVRQIAARIGPQNLEDGAEPTRSAMPKLPVAVVTVPQGELDTDQPESNPVEEPPERWHGCGRRRYRRHHHHWLHTEPPRTALRGYDEPPANRETNEDEGFTLF